MPRNAAKKTNKNAKRLPVLIKLTNINNNNNKIKKKKVNSGNKNKKANSNSKNSTNRNSNINKSRNKNTTSIINLKKKQQQHQNIKIEKAIVNASLTRVHKINDSNCDANVSISTTSIPENSYAATFIKNPIVSLEQQRQQSILKDFQRNFFKSIKLDDDNDHHIKAATSNNLELQGKTILNIKLDEDFDGIVKSKIVDNCTNSSRSLSSDCDICEKEIDSLQTTSLSSPSSPNSSVSSLYPIVIETTEILQQQHQLDKYNKEELQQQHQLQQLKGDKEFNNKKKYKKLHSNNNNNTTTTTVYYQTANDTLKQQQEQQYKSQHNITSNNNKNSFSSIKISKRNNNCNNNNNNNNNLYKQHKQSRQTKARATATSIQSQEVKARLATLRTRKKVFQQQQHQQQEKPLLHDISHRGHKTSLTLSSTLSVDTSEICAKIDCCKSSHTVSKGYIKRAPLVLDDATLNLIETLNDNEFKKSNNKRKRNTSTALLTLASLHQPRPRRITTAILPPDKSTPTITTVGGITTAAAAAVPPPSTDKNEQKQIVGGQFLKPLPVETTNTNSKKRARIMSLYERPFQAANEGRGSVMSNGYMTSSRSSASSGGVGGGAMIINDVNDTQEMANQYYLSGSSGSGLAGNSSSSLVGNGGVMNHAPTMGTLCNIGNTCYLNSVVYTLRFAPQFLHNLHHLLADLNALQQNIARARAKSSSLGRGISAVHMENARSWSSKDLASMEQYGSASIAGTSTAVNVGSHITNSSTALTQVTQKSCHQLLTEKLHELYQSLHRNEINESTEPHHADTLLHAIQDVSSIFEGNQQQDAHEFLMCLLNSIRETSQTLIKAIAECPDVILNGYISNPDEMERDLMKNHASGVSGGGGVVVSGGNSNSNSNSLASTTLSSLTSSKTSSFFSRKSKRKDDSKNSKNSRLQSPLKDALLSGGNAAATSTANSLFYLNTNDLNSATSSSSTSPASGITMLAGVSGSSGAIVTSPSNSSTHLSGIGGGGGGCISGGDETDASTAVALILKDKQRLECKIRELGLDFFNEDFEGITVSTTKCLSCETITEQKETMIDIAVPVPQAGYESNEFMDRPSSFIQNSCITREYFRNENKYRCEQCCGYTEAIRSISYEVLPRLLIIQLSRFSGGMEKINSYIPTSFTLQCFCSKCCELSDANKLHIYKLYSVITHVGATMSVGHYIAYTCSLEWANEYINCPKEQRRRASQERSLSAAAAGNGSSGGIGANNTTQSASSGSSSGLGSSGNSFMKMKMKFGRSKASSSGDMSKNVKQLNGLNSSNSSSSSKAITNGIGKLTMNNSSATSGGNVAAATPQCPVTCQSINCCAMRLTAQQQLQYQSANNSTSDFSEETSQYSNGSSYNTAANYNNNIHHVYTTNNASTNTSGYGSTGRGSTKASYAMQNNCNEPIWYMCDDDKIKAMTQREFEELLSPARKITITPYLLFYARYNLQSTPPKSATASTSSPGPATSSPQTSWSNESLQSSGHSAHSSGIRM